MFEDVTGNMSVGLGISACTVFHNMSYIYDQMLCVHLNRWSSNLEKD